MLEERHRLFEESFAAYQVIEKPNALMDLLRETDPRDDRSGKAADAARTIADEIGLHSRQAIKWRFAVAPSSR